MVNVWSMIKSKIEIILFWVIRKRTKGLTIEGLIKINGIPEILISNEAQIIIGNNVTLNSSNYGYHANMYGKVKLMADRLNAIISIGENTRIHGSCLHAYNRIIIGKNCLVAANCQIFDGNGHDICEGHPEDRIRTNGGSKEIIIGDNVWIGMNSSILPGVTIGSGSVVAAGSVVIKDIPENVIAGGNPAKIIKKLRQ